MRSRPFAAAALAVALAAMRDDSLGVNPARIDGGAANNVVPDHAVLRFNIRPACIDAAKSFEKNLKDLLCKTAAEHEVGIGGVADERSHVLLPVTEGGESLLAAEFGVRDHVADELPLGGCVHGGSHPGAYIR